MKTLSVHIREIDKGNRNLSLFNLRDEVVNFMYKFTVVNSTKADLQFFVLIYFLSINVGNKSYIEVFLDESLPHFKDLTKAFNEKKSYLRANEYRQMVDQHGLRPYFHKDIFFILTNAVLNIDEIDKRYSAFYENDNEIKQTVSRLKLVYKPVISELFSDFSKSKIRDDRYDENGEYHDLSKSVYRPVLMRSSRSLTIDLQKNTKVQTVKSNSPVDLTFLQYIDIQLIFDIWDKFHVANLAIEQSLKFADSNALGHLIAAYAIYASKRESGAARKERDEAKAELEREKSKNTAQLEKLTIALMESVLKSDVRLEQEKNKVRKEITKLLGKEQTAENKQSLKTLSQRLDRLENMVVETKVIEE